MRQKHASKQKDILFVIISSFVVVVAWIGFNLYHIHVTSTVAPEIQLLLTPIDPTFDTQTIQKLKSRTTIVPSFERKEIATSAAQPTISPQNSSAPVASNSTTQSAPISILGQ